MIHNYPESFRLVPLGHWNWKWNPARAKYLTYEQELLSGVLTIASQYRILSHLPIIWFCDHEALKNYLDKEPPTNHRQRRWYVYLSQFQLRVVHIPGLKNELCDWLSRHDFDGKIGTNCETLAQEAFIRMDRQLDLGLQAILILATSDLKMSNQDYKDSEYKSLWEKLEPHQSSFEDEQMFYRTENELFCERKLVIPTQRIPEAIKWCHQANAHPGPERTIFLC